MSVARVSSSTGMYKRYMCSEYMNLEFERTGPTAHQTAQQTRNELNYATKCHDLDCGANTVGGEVIRTEIQAMCVVSSGLQRYNDANNIYAKSDSHHHQERNRLVHVS